MHVPPQLLDQLPLLVLFVVPVIGAYFGLRKVNMKSAIHFQQGTKGSSAWRAAVTMTILTLPSFTFWCLLMRGPSALGYQLGFSLAVVTVFCSVAGILHYVPSPSLYAYTQLRFLSQNLRLVLSILQTVVTLVCIVLVLLHSSALLVTVSVFSLYLCVALCAFFPLFGIVFSGYASIMTPTLVLNMIFIVLGAGAFLCFGIKDATSFRSIVPFEFSLSDSVISLCVGYVVSLYQLSSSPLFYQAYFPIPTLYKLRLALAFHGVFQLFSSIVIFLTISLFFAFMEKRCSLQYSYETFFQFIKYTVPHPAIAYAVIVSILSVFMFSIQWLYTCITTHIWEEFIKVHLKELSSMKQLCCVQAVMLIICTISVMMASAVRLLQLPYYLLTPFVILTVLTLCGAMCGVFTCGYFLPFCNSKGALTALVITSASSIGLFYLFASNNQLPTLKNDCAAETIANTTVQIRSFNMEKVMVMASHVPLQAHPIIAFLMVLVLCPIVSLFTGGQDQMGLDWNLVVIPCFGSFGSRASYSKRPFVESESFRYAQHTAGPGLLKCQR